MPEHKLSTAVPERTESAWRAEVSWSVETFISKTVTEALLKPSFCGLLSIYVMGSEGMSGVLAIDKTIADLCVLFSF